jgi:hypothetical protein
MANPKNLAIQGPKTTTKGKIALIGTGLAENLTIMTVWHLDSGHGIGSAFGVAGKKSWAPISRPCVDRRAGGGR